MRSNANSLFRNRNLDPNISGRPPRLRYNNFGGTIGGPLCPAVKRHFSSSRRSGGRSAAPRSRSPRRPSSIRCGLTDPTNANYVAPENRDPIAVRLCSRCGRRRTTSSGRRRSFLNPQSPNVNDTRQSGRADRLRLHAELETRRPVYPRPQSRRSNLAGCSRIPLCRTSRSPTPPCRVTSWPSSCGRTRGRALNEFKLQFSSNRIRTTDDRRNQKSASPVRGEHTGAFPENEAGRIPSIADLPGCRQP